MAFASPGQVSKLNGPLTSGGNVVGFHIRPDGAHVAYVANQQDSGIYELYDKEFASQDAPIRLSATMAASGVHGFEYTADGSHVVYSADQDSDSAEIFLVDGSNPGVSSKLKGGLTPGGEIWGFSLVP